MPEPLRTLHSRHPPLRELAVVAVNGCNQRCSYCWQRGGEPVLASWQAVARAARRLMSSPEEAVLISFTGGEPLLAFPLIRRTVEYVESHRRRGQRVYYRLQTNGVLLDASTIAFLARHRFDLRVSVDGGRQAQEGRCAGTFERIERLFRHLRDDHPNYLATRVTAAATVTPRNAGVLGDSVSYLLSTGAASVLLSPAVIAEATPGKVARTLADQLEKVTRTAVAHYRRTSRQPLSQFRVNRTPASGRRSPWCCAAPVNRSLAVDVDGTTAPCALAGPTFAPAAAPGLRPAIEALRALSRSDGRAAPAARRFRLFRRDAPRYSALGRCADCRWNEECAVCPLISAKLPAWPDPLKVPDFVCQFRQALLEQRAHLPACPPFTPA